MQSRVIDCRLCRPMYVCTCCYTPNQFHIDIGTPEWDEFLQSYMGRWKARLKNWVLDSCKQAVHVVRYEDLQRNVPGEVAKILNFLKIPFNKEELPIRLDGDFTKFKRKHTNDNFEHFSSNQTEFIRRTLVDTIKLARLANKSHILQVEDYLP